MPPPTASLPRRWRDRELVARLLRYAGGSGVAFACSEVAFLLLYGPVGASPALSSVVGWLAGAVPNYWLNRWAWRRRGRPSLRREVLPYVVIILATVGLAVVATSAVHAAVDQAVGGGLRVAVVNATFLAVYAVVFAVRYVLLDRLFRRPGRNPAEGGPPWPAPPPTPPAPEPSPEPPAAPSRTPRAPTSGATARSSWS